MLGYRWFGAWMGSTRHIMSFGAGDHKANRMKAASDRAGVTAGDR